MTFSLTSLLALQAFGGALSARPHYEERELQLQKIAKHPVGPFSAFGEVSSKASLVQHSSAAASAASLESFTRVLERFTPGVAAAAPEPVVAAEEVEDIAEADERTSAVVAAVAPEPALAAEEVEETPPEHDSPVNMFEETFAEDTKGAMDAAETEAAGWNRNELPQVLEEASESWKKLPTEQVSSKISLVRHSFAAVSAATGLPVWGVRAAAWPVFMHPGVAASVVALDMAVSYANLTDVAVSYIELPSSSVSLAQQAPADAGNAIITVTTLVIVNSLLALVVGCVHQKRVTARRPEFPDPVQDGASMAEEPHDFHNNAIRCCGKCTCLYAMCVPGVRHADTLTTTGLFGYWPTVWVFIVVQLVFGAIFATAEEANGWFRVFVDLDAALLRGLALAVVFVPHRRALRSKLESPVAGCLINDCALWILCSWCVVAQEGLEVDAAEGVTVSCPCRLTDTKTGELVGAPVAEVRDEAD